MTPNISHILSQKQLSHNDLVTLLAVTDPNELSMIFALSDKIRRESVGDKVYMRGLIEYSNKCQKNCLYCGIRCGNQAVNRYELSETEVLEAVDFAWKNQYGSVVIQSGERSDKAFVNSIESILKKIKSHTSSQVGVTLSCGEQSEETYMRWFDAGAHRYLLRIEASNPRLFARIHPGDGEHGFDVRLKALKTLIKCGYQTGTGVMIGLPGQSLSDLASDLLFFRDSGVHMVGMGPYIEHEQTPLYDGREALLPKQERYMLTMKMLALLRIMVPDINMASTTALQAIDPAGRTMALRVGANVIMPNVTPQSYRENYQLYEGKPGMQQSPEDSKQSLDQMIAAADLKAGYNEWGDPKRFFAK